MSCFELDGARVRGKLPLSADTLEAVREVIRAARELTGMTQEEIEAKGAVQYGMPTPRQRALFNARSPKPTGGPT